MEREQSNVHVLAENRLVVAGVIAAGLGQILRRSCPFPADDPLLQFLQANRPAAFSILLWSWTAMLFTTPFLLVSSGLATGYIFVPRRKGVVAGPLPPFPDLAARTRLEVVVG
jgi:hypothetical protein